MVFPRQSFLRQTKDDPALQSAPAAESDGNDFEDVSEPAEMTPSASADLKLQISVNRVVWVSITADGVQQWQGTMQPEQMRQIQASNSIRMTVSNAAGVELTLNGRPLPALGGDGEVRTITLTAQDMEPATLLN